MDLIYRAIAAVPAGRYIVAVSGGIDSMVLLHAFAERPDIEVIVGHVDHGIRTDGSLDEATIVQFCESHNILYKTTALNLGKNASEATARKARYAFLQQCLKEYNADAIITAHHRDDLIETAVINMMRGTGWRGIAPFSDGQRILRPLLEVTKNDVREYAAKHGIAWRDDSTNTDQTYLRNYVRLSVVPWLTVQNSQWQKEIMRHIRKQRQLRRTIETEINALLGVYVKNITGQPTGSRYMWGMLPKTVAIELLQALCKHVTGNSLTAPQAVAAFLFIRVAKPGKHMPLTKNLQLRVTRTEFIVEPY